MEWAGLIPGIIWGSLLPELKGCYFWSPGSLSQTEAPSELYIYATWRKWAGGGENGKALGTCPMAPHFLKSQSTSLYPGSCQHLPSSTSPAWGDDGIELWIRAMTSSGCMFSLNKGSRAESRVTELEWNSLGATLPSPLISVPPFSLSLFGKWHHTGAPEVTRKGLGSDEENQVSPGFLELECLVPRKLSNQNRKGKTLSKCR